MLLLITQEYLNHVVNKLKLCPQNSRSDQRPSFQVFTINEKGLLTKAQRIQYSGGVEIQNVLNSHVG